MSTELAGERPIYACAERQRDGRLRILSEHEDARDALQAAKLHAWGGHPAQVFAITKIVGMELADAA